MQGTKRECTDAPADRMPCERQVRYQLCCLRPASEQCNLMAERDSPSPAEYAQVLRMLGNGRLEAQCIDGIKRLCHIRGKMRKKVWVNMVSSSQHA
jgi:Translation initiation factor 1A / IF-1